VSRAEQQLRWSAAWWIGHALVGFGVAVLATAMLGRKATVPAAILGVVAHHALDTPVALALYRDGI
jgi:hypothetical protein